MTIHFLLIYILHEGMDPPSWTPVLGHGASSTTKWKELLPWISIDFDCLP